MVAANKRAIGVTLLFSTVGVGLIVAAFSTDHWIMSHPEGSGLQNNRTLNNTGGSVNFGLFSGFSELNFGMGMRSAPLLVECEPGESVCAMAARDDQILFKTEDLVERIVKYKTQGNATAHKGVEMFGLFSFPLYLATLVLLVLAVVFGLVTIGFTIFNVFGRPIETITGPSGLFLWSTLALIFTIAGVSVFSVLFTSQLEKNVLTLSSQSSSSSGDLNDLLTSKNLTNLNYSFWMVVGAAAAFLLNLVTLGLSGQFSSCGYNGSGEKEVDNGKGIALHLQY